MRTAEDIDKKLEREIAKHQRHENIAQTISAIMNRSKIPIVEPSEYSNLVANHWFQNEILKITMDSRYDGSMENYYSVHTKDVLGSITDIMTPWALTVRLYFITSDSNNMDRCIKAAYHLALRSTAWRTQTPYANYTFNKDPICANLSTIAVNLGSANDEYYTKIKNTKTLIITNYDPIKASDYALLRFKDVIESRLSDMSATTIICMGEKEPNSDSTIGKLWNMDFNQGPSVKITHGFVVKIVVK